MSFQATKDVAAVTEGLGNELKGVAQDLDVVSSTADANAKASEANTKGLSDAKDDIKGLKDEAAQLKTQIASLGEQLEVFEKAMAFGPAMCDHLDDPLNGKVEIIGDHGGKVPVSVTAYYKCNTKFYLVGSAATTTCQLSGSKALWSGTAAGKHPGCKPCMERCTECATPSACIRCSPGSVLINKKCVLTPGLDKSTAADSCKHIQDISPDIKTTEQGYWIKLSDGTPRRMQVNPNIFYIFCGWDPIFCYMR